MHDHALAARTAKAQASLHSRADSPEPSLVACDIHVRSIYSMCWHIK